MAFDQLTYREFANESKKRSAPHWKETCKEYGRLGMKYGEKAIALNPGSGEEAKALLLKVSASNDKYYAGEAKRLMAQM